MRIYLLSLVAMLAAGSAMAQVPAEKFVFKKPDGFVMFNSAGDNSFYNAEFVPDGEQKGSVWKTRVLLQGFHDGKVRNPADFNAEQADSFKKYCAQAVVQAVLVDGAAMTEMTCTDKPAYRLLKTMQGAETFYLVQYEFRFAPTDAQKQAARAYLDGIKLCAAGAAC